MAGKGNRGAAAIRHFAVIARDRGLLDALARSASYAVRRLRRIVQDTARRHERRIAHRIPSARTQLPERLDRPGATVRIAVGISSNRNLTNATLRALKRLRDETPFSYELTLASGSEALSALAASANEANVAFLPAGVVPLDGWLDCSLAAAEGLQADAVVSNFEETTGCARTIIAGDIESAIIRKLRFPPERWAFAPDAQAVDLRPGFGRTAVRTLEQRRITVVDVNVPMPDRDGGSVRMREILSILARENDVAFVAAEGRKVEPYCTQLRQAGIGVILDSDEAMARIRSSAVVWIARPSCAEKYLPLARSENPQVLVVYDTVDLHHVRERRAGAAGWEHTREAEARAIRDADIVIAVSEIERAIADELGARRSAVIPTMHRAVTAVPGYFERSGGALFVGSFDHAPNVDAATYLAKEVMPAVWKRDSAVTLTIAGSNPTRVIRELSNDRIHVAGFVRDLDPLLRSHRLSVAPLRFGAGLKAKITQSFAYGLPVVATSVAAEGFGSAALGAMVVADDAQTLARAIVDVCRDHATWNSLSRRARTAAEAYTPAAVSGVVLDAVASRPETE